MPASGLPSQPVAHIDHSLPAPIQRDRPDIPIDHKVFDTSGSVILTLLHLLEQMGARPGGRCDVRSPE